MRAPEFKCHHVYGVLLSHNCGLLSKALRKSRRVGDEAIKKAGKKTLLSSSELHCPSPP